MVCHTSPVENAIKILECSSLLSPVLARKMSAAELAKEARNAANDPEDYFDYIMFAWKLSGRRPTCDGKETRPFS